MTCGMGMGCFLVGLTVELHNLFPWFVKEPSIENMLPLGIVLIVGSILAIRYLEKKAPIADEEMKFSG
jgi:hypothetical protein